VDKHTAVMVLRVRPDNAKSAAQELGVPRPTLYNRETRFLGQDAMKPEQAFPQGSEQTELERQLEVLRREIRRLKLEQDIPKKANER
jgi:hypothetical protein